MADRALLPNWPRYMTVGVAAQYYGITATAFRTLGICPVNIDGVALYDRRSLDLYADRLSGLSDATTGAPDLDARIAAFGAA